MPITDMDDEFTKDQSSILRGQLITAAAKGTRVKDAGAARDWASGEVKVPFAHITSAAAANPTTSMTVAIVAADDAALTTNAVTLSTITILVADCDAGSAFAMPPLTPGYSKRYLGVSFTPNGGNATTGAWVVGLIDKNARPQNNGGNVTL